MMRADVARRLLDSLETGVVLLDGSFRLSAINSAAEALLSLSRRQVAGQRMDRVLPGANPLARAIRRAAEAQAPLTERDLELHTGTGTILLDCTITPLLETDEILVELSNVERHHRIAREETMQAQTLVSAALVQGLAHEIKNPLGGIRGAAQLLERELADESQREYTRIIVGEVDRLRALIDRMVQPGSRARPTAMNVHEALEHVRELVEAEGRGACRIRVDYDPSLPDIVAVPDDLIQVFLNLVRNAVEATGEGGVVQLRSRAQRLVTLAGRQHRLCLRIEVRDDGPGVPDLLRESIFFPMVTGRAEGTGLGLAIAQSIIQRLGGVIEFESSPGDTRFIVLIPVPESE